MQPLLITVIVICIINLLVTISLANRLSNLKTGRNEGVETAPAMEPQISAEKIYAGNDDVNGEIAAIISAALHLYKEEHHDLENTVLTIDKVSKAYSPWSSKIYGLRKNPR